MLQIVGLLIFVMVVIYSFSLLGYGRLFYGCSTNWGLCDCLDCCLLLPVMTNSVV